MGYRVVAYIGLVEFHGTDLVWTDKCWWEGDAKDDEDAINRTIAAALAQARATESWIVSMQIAIRKRPEVTT